jgi:molybdopterin/thiamine biosynthesis adenylyltransferase
MNQYYTSHTKLSLIGAQGQTLLQGARVLVIGAGGLGCPCLQYLAGMGIGLIGVADYDVVSESNLHRQILYSYTDIGKSKVSVSVEKLSAQNPFIKIQAHSILVDETNVISLLEGYDIIVDGTDNFQVRYLINDACVFLNKPLVYGAIHQTEGHVTVFNYKQSPTLRCMFLSEENSLVQSCADIGAYNIATGVIGLMMANEVMKIVLEHTTVMSSTLWQFDVLTGKSVSIRYQENILSRQISLERFSQISLPKEINSEQLKEIINQTNTFFLLDVREANEREIVNIGGLQIPLQNLLQQSSFPFTFSDQIVVYCQKGMRSKQATQYLIQKGFMNVSSLRGGIENYLAL